MASGEAQGSAKRNQIAELGLLLIYHFGILWKDGEYVNESYWFLMYKNLYLRGNKLYILSLSIILYLVAITH